MGAFSPTYPLQSRQAIILLHIQLPHLFKTYLLTVSFLQNECILVIIVGCNFRGERGALNEARIYGDDGNDYRTIGWPTYLLTTGHYPLFLCPKAHTL